MNIQQCRDTLSNDNLRVTAVVLQAIDELAEHEYETFHRKEIGNELGNISEHEMASIVEKNTQEFPPLMMAANSFGYNMLTTHAYNALIAIRMPEKAQFMLDSRL